MNTLISLSINPYASNMRYLVYHTTTFTAITSILLMIAVCYIAWKYPAKLHSLGSIIMVFGFLCFFVAMIQVFDEFQKGHYVDIHDLLYQKFESGQSITREDMSSTGSIWRYITSPLASAFAVLFWSTFNYLISRILYIIRTPRI